MRTTQQFSIAVPLRGVSHDGILPGLRVPGVRIAF